jgi:hypothetical protein
MNPSTQSTTLYAPAPTDEKARRKMDKKTFTFDNSFWSVNTDDKHYANQAEVYNCLGEEFLDHNFEGYHTCIFAYVRDTFEKNDGMDTYDIYYRAKLGQAKVTRW